MIAKKLLIVDDKNTGTDIQQKGETAALLPVGEFVIQHYLLVQTGIKDLLWSKHYVERFFPSASGSRRSIVEDAVR